MASDGFQKFLMRSLRLLEREKPAVFDRLCTMLAGKELDFEIDDASTVLRFTPAPRVEPAAHAPHIRLRSDRRTILDVVDGLSLEDAVTTDRIVLAGALDDLVLFHDALSTYLHGAIRAPSFSGLLNEYRAAGTRRTTAPYEPER